MNEVILITGANGLIAKQLSVKLAKNYSVRFLSRNKKRENEFEWNVEQGTLQEESLLGVQHIIHLAGASVSGKRWTKKRKHEILSSRVKSAQLLLDALKRNNIKINSFISASAVGFYGTETTDNVYTEEDDKGQDFLADVCFQWEQIADQFLREGRAERIVKLRTGVVLSDKGGALKQLKMPIDKYMGVTLGNGKQHIPWIHIDDICALYAFAINDSSLNGIYNAVSPTSTSNHELTKMIASVLKKPLLFPNIPSFIIRLIFGEAAIILLAGSRVSAGKIEHAGFHFKYPDLRLALENLLKKKLD